VLGLCVTPAVQATNIIWVSDRFDDNADGVPDDMDWVAFLKAQGYTVDFQGTTLGNGYWRTLDAAKITQLNAADLIIFARSTNSGDYANAPEPTQWNGIKTPIIMTAAHLCRVSRWVWFNSDTLQAYAPTPTLVALDPHHPIYQGVHLNARNEVDIYDQSVGSAQVSLMGVLDVGNGTLLAKALTGDWTVIAEWQPGTPFYAGGTETPAGKRMLFCAGTVEGAGLGRGDFNLNEEGKRLFLNAIEYLTGKLVREPWVKAWQPDPADGTVNLALPLFKWTPGETALLHSVYLGTTPELTEADRVADRQPLAMYFAPALKEGTKYYWRVDEVDLSGTVHTGDVWSFVTASPVAYDPQPRHGAKWLDPAAITLQWQPAQGALKHDVYFGTDRAGVAEGAAGAFKGNQVTTTFSPGPLAANTTYYWRVDEIMLDGTKRAGEVWAFTTLGPGGGLRGLYFANPSLSGEPVLNQIDSRISFDWADAAPAGLPVDGFSVRWVGELDVPFTETYTFFANTDDGVRLWVNDVQLLDLWTNRRSPTEAKASIVLVGGQRYPIIMEVYNVEGTAVAELRWQSPSIPRELIPQPAFSLALRASNPSPGNDSVNVPQTSTLTWTAGEKAAHHEVYFGADSTAVAGATAADASIYQGRQTKDVTDFDPGELEWGKTYYWRVDEINAAEADSPWKGPVWKFTAADFLVVDDFESYTDIEGDRVYETWIDGWTNGTGSRVGYMQAPFAERTIVHGGKQSMPLDYNNVKTPFYSEAERQFSAAENWTVNGVADLVLYVRGKGNNGAGQLYVALEDSSGKLAVATHPDPAVVQTAAWTEWRVPLSNFAGVNPAKIKKIYIGVGDRAAPTAGGAGLLYVDDIRVARPPQ
jgi:hypothetical protein